MTAKGYAQLFNETFKRWDVDFLLLPQGLGEMARHLAKLEAVLGEDHPKVKKTRVAFHLAVECHEAGIRFLWPHKERSHPTLFTEENGNIRLPF